MDNFIVQLIARLDASKTSSDLDQIEQKLNAKGINLKTVLDTATTQKELKNFAKQMQSVLKEMGIDIDTSSILSSLKQVQKQAEQTRKEQQEGTKENIKLRKQELENIKTKKKELEEEARLTNAKTKKAKADHNAAMQQIKEQRQALAENRKLEEEQGRKTSSQKQLETINEKLTTNSFTKDVSNASVEYSKLSTVTDELKKDFAELQRLEKALGESKTDEELISNYEKFNSTLDKVRNTMTVLANEQKKAGTYNQDVLADQKKIDTLAESVLKFRDNNTKMSNDLRSQFTGIYDFLINGTNLTEKEVKELAQQFNNLKLKVREVGQLGQSFGDKMKNAFQKFSEWGFATGIITSITSKFREAITELKEIDTLLTEITKANDKLTKTQLTEIADDGFDIASKYGKKATDYLSGVQEASRAGYDNVEQIAELSIAIQGAGDVTADTANSYVIATDKAYKLGGSVEALTKIFDGSNKITNENAVTMTDLAEGMSIVGSTAASFGIEANETTAAIATMSAATQQSGSEIARAFRAILLNIRQVSDEEENIDAEGLTKYEKACDALGVSLKETKNGVLSLRDPMEVLEDLSKAYNELDEADIRRTNLLSSVGGKLRSTALDALLRQFDDYKTMLQQYEDGTGSMAREAEKTANSWEGSINRLSNSWTDFINNFVKTDDVKNIVNFLNNVVTLLDKITGHFGSIPLILGGLGTIVTNNLGLD